MRTIVHAGQSNRPRSRPVGHQLGHQFLILGSMLVLLAGCGQAADPLAAQQRIFEQQQAQARQIALEPLQRASVAAWYLFLGAVPLVAVGVSIAGWI